LILLANSGVGLKFVGHFLAAFPLTFQERGGRFAINLPLFSFWLRYPLAETLKLLAGLIVIRPFSPLSGAFALIRRIRSPSSTNARIAVKNCNGGENFPYLCGLHGRDGLVSEDPIWRVPSAECVGRGFIKNDAILPKGQDSVAFSRDSKKLASGNLDKTVLVGKSEIRNYNPTVCFSLNSNIGEPLMPILLSVSAGDLDGDALQELASQFIEGAK
jgi:hypothetical protein